MKRAKNRMDSKKQINEIIEMLTGLSEDLSIPKNVKDRLEATARILKEDSELKIRINKALHELDEIADDPNLDSYNRTQVWNIVSMLEKSS